MCFPTGIIEVCLQDLLTVPDECSIQSDAAVIRSVSYFLIFSSMMAIFTSEVCIEQRLPMTIILPSSAESFFKETVESGPEGWLARFSLIVDLLLVVSHISYPLHNNSIGI